MLDEPSMGLAPIFVEKIFEIVSEINEQGTTILLVEQNALMALDAAQRGYVLETGRVALADDAKSLREKRAGPEDVPRGGVPWRGVGWPAASRFATERKHDASSKDPFSRGRISRPRRRSCGRLWR
jgi:ABC-type multidrug transport system ATPase subunit